jgi:dihydrolipoamide dehydrogenase
MAEKFDIAVIGAGPGGFRAAKRCAQKGASVAIIEKEVIGGTCLNCGCIPLKALLASAHTLITAKQAAAMGIDIASAIPNWPKIQNRRDEIINSLRKGMADSMRALGKIKFIQGSATVLSPNKIKVEADSQPIEVQADKIIIATGSQPIQIPQIPFDGQTVISSKEALTLPQIPKSMIIIGGGVIGCEMACVYAAMGTKITIIEAMPNLLPMEDKWVGRLLEREFKKLGIDILTGQKAASLDKSSSPAKLVLENGRTIESEKILVSVGRKPFIDKETIRSLNLKMSGPAIEINEKMETSVPGVYAIGDVTGKTYLAHGATAQAEAAAANATGGNKTLTDYSLIPRVIYTFPEVASVGKTEEACKAEGIETSVEKAFFRANGRAVAQNETAGEARVIRDNQSNKIVGITIVGATATELITLARMFIGTSEKTAHITFPHPTFSETLEEAIQND